jgi:hypothetical protein
VLPDFCDKIYQTITLSRMTSTSGGPLIGLNNAIICNEMFNNTLLMNLI